MVPVDRVNNGMSPTSAATALWVPSPPSTAISATSRSAIRRAARRVSSTVWRRVRSRNSRAGQWLLRAWRLWLFFSTAAAMPIMSVGINTCSMPVAPKARQQALDYRDLVGAGKQPGIGGQAPHVTARCGIGDDAHGQWPTAHGATEEGTGERPGQEDPRQENIDTSLLLLDDPSKRAPEVEQGRCQLRETSWRWPGQSGQAVIFDETKRAPVRRAMSACTRWRRDAETWRLTPARIIRRACLHPANGA